MGISCFCINEGVSWDLYANPDEWERKNFNRFTGKFLSETETLHDSIKKLRDMNFSDPNILTFCNSILDKLCYYNSTFLRRFMLLYITEQYRYVDNDPEDISNKNRKIFILNKDKMAASPLKYTYAWQYTVFNENQNSIYGIFDSMKNCHYTESILPIPSIFETVDGGLANWTMDDYMSSIYSINANTIKAITKEDSRSMSLQDVRYDLYRNAESSIIPTEPGPSRHDDAYIVDDQIAKSIKLRKIAAYNIAADYQDLSSEEAIEDVKKLVLSIINYAYISAFLAKSKLDCVTNAITRDNVRSKMLTDFISSVNNKVE